MSLHGLYAFAKIHCHVSHSLRYCVLLITGDEEPLSFGKQAFLSFASTNAKEVVRFAYVYQRLQQPLCDILMQNQDSAHSSAQVQLMSNFTAASSSVILQIVSFNNLDLDKKKKTEHTDLRKVNIVIISSTPKKSSFAI